MDIALIVGRVIFGGYFLMNAYNHLFKGSHMVGYAASKGVPAPKLAIMGSGVLLLIGGLSMIFGYAPSIGIAAIVLFLLPVTFMMHPYWKETDPSARMNQSIAFFKNMAILGAALMILSIPSPWVYSL